MELKRIAALTMVRNDDFYLSKWVEYYGAQLGKENLYIFFDGQDQTVPSFCEGTRTSLEPKIPGKVVELEKRRLDFLSDRAAALLGCGYDLVIGVDADELLIVDPRLGIGLREFLSRRKIRTSLSGLGLDFGQKLGEEGPIDGTKPFLQQRRYAQIGTRYTKPSVIAKPVKWGRGFHRVKYHNFHIAKDLYLFHFGYFDKGRIEERFGDPSRLSQGQARHMRKRSRTIRYVSSLRARPFDRWTCIGRWIQTIFRPPYAINKPSMLEMRIVVRIPERFTSII